MGIKKKFMALTGVVGVMLIVVSLLGYFMAYRALDTSIQGEIAANMEAQRQGVRNKLRRASDPEEREHLKQKSSAITEQLKPLRKDLKTARDIEAQIPAMQQALETERKMETQALQRERNRSQER